MKTSEVNLQCNLPNNIYVTSNSRHMFVERWPYRQSETELIAVLDVLWLRNDWRTIRTSVKSYPIELWLGVVAHDVGIHRCQISGPIIAESGPMSKERISQIYLHPFVCSCRTLQQQYVVVGILLLFKPMYGVILFLRPVIFRSTHVHYGIEVVYSEECCLDPFLKFPYCCGFLCRGLFLRCVMIASSDEKPSDSPHPSSCQAP